METLKEKLKKSLDEMAYDIPIATSCSMFWGEVEVPECLRKELENREEEE